MSDLGMKPDSTAMTSLLALRDWTLLIIAFAVALFVVVVGYGMLLERVVTIAEMAR